MTETAAYWLDLAVAEADPTEALAAIRANRKQDQ